MLSFFFSFFFFTSIVASVTGDGAENLTFGIINGNSDFFDPVKLGWEQNCKDLGVKCYYADIHMDPNYNESTEYPDSHLLFEQDFRTATVRKWISMNFNGIAFHPYGPVENQRLLIEEATAAGVPIVTFDGDTPNSTRVAYVGTNQRFFGKTMAKLLRQLRPEGGTFAMIGYKEERSEGFIEEITKYNDKDDSKAPWYQVERNFSKELIFMEHAETYALLNPTAIVTIIQTPMRNPNWTDFVDANRHRGITFIGSDGSDYQLDYLQQRYVDGLVGQLPFEMGTKSLQVLYDLATKGTVEKEIVSTNVVAYNLIPLELPPLAVNQNLLGSLKIVGFTCFGVVALSALACIAWTLYHRTRVVVRAAQPFFLVLVASGMLIMSSSLVPLSFDDGGQPESMSTTYSVGICMSRPWLAFTGFTMTFAALLSKTWRVNRLFHAKVRFARMQVSKNDVLAPFVLLLTSNIVVLICWTVLDPLTYVRQEHDGTDYWNRVISTYGGCRSNSIVPYVAPLAAINLSAVALSCWQAFQARSIQSEFSEAKYIGLSVASLFQAFLTGIPVVVVARDNPQAYYLVLSLFIFVVCIAVLLLIFLPKMSIQRKYAEMSESEQRQMVGQKIRQSSANYSTGFSRSMSGMASQPLEAHPTQEQGQDPESGEAGNRDPSTKSEKAYIENPASVEGNAELQFGSCADDVTSSAKD